MAISITHSYVATGADEAGKEVNKAEWNAALSTSMATGRLLGRTTAGAGAFEEIVTGTGISFASLTLSLDLTYTDGRYAQTSQIRERLTTDRTYYVRTDGNDSNTGLADSSGGAFATIQKAYDTICANLDLAGHQAIIQLGAGTFTSAAPLIITQPWAGGGSVAIRGDPGAPGSYAIEASSLNGIRVTIPLPGKLFIGGVKISCPSFRAAIIVEVPGADVVIDDTTHIGDCGFCFYANSGRITTAADIEISLVGAVTNYVLYALNLGKITGNFAIFNVTVNQALSIWARAEQGAVMDVPGQTFNLSVGVTVTGFRYNAIRNGIIKTDGGGANYFPGDSAGSVATGGIYF